MHILQSFNGCAEPARPRPFRLLAAGDRVVAGFNGCAEPARPRHVTNHRSTRRDRTFQRLRGAGSTATVQSAAERGPSDGFNGCAEPARPRQVKQSDNRYAFGRVSTAARSRLDRDERKGATRAISRLVGFNGCAEPARPRPVDDHLFVTSQLQFQRLRGAGPTATWSNRACHICPVSCFNGCAEPARPRRQRAPRRARRAVLVSTAARSRPDRD